VPWLRGWRIASATRGISIAYALVFVLGGVLIMGGLLIQGWAPFVLAAAGAFMLVGPAILAGFFGIAQALEAGSAPGAGAIIAGFRSADRALWALALVCGLLFMIFVTDAAILYAYMVGGTPVWLTDLLPANANVAAFVRWAGVSGLVVALLLFCISAFSVPLLCERRVGLVGGDCRERAYRTRQFSAGHFVGIFAVDRNNWQCVLATTAATDLALAGLRKPRFVPGNAAGCVSCRCCTAATV
jgi:hypothetical protein